MNGAKRWEDINRDFLTVSAPPSSGVEIAIVEEDCPSRQAWTVQAPYNSIFVHLAGKLDSLEARFENGPETSEIPVVGCVWIVPAGQRCDIVVSGTNTRFCEIRIPTMGPHLAGVEVGPQINVRDRLLHEAAQVFQQQAGKDAIVRTSTRHLAEAVRWHIIERYDINTGRQAAESKKLTSSMEARIASYVNDRLGNRITLEELAQVVALDVHVLLKKFYASFGTTPAQHITCLRMERAKTLLTSSSLQIGEIAAVVGFHSPSHFCVSFMKNVGIAPMAFRQAHRSAHVRGGGDRRSA